MALRIVFMGTAELACASLRALSEWPGCEVVAVVTQPDKPRGRDLQVLPSAVKALAQQFAQPVLQPLKAREEAFLIQLRETKPDLIVVVAYGQILPAALLGVPRYGAINVHTSLLPRHRGAAPIQWAILSGDKETGVTIMQMDPGLDTGPILTQARTPISPSDNSQTLHDRLAEVGAELLVSTIPGFVDGSIVPIPQPAEGATYARKISKEDGLLNWAEPAEMLWHKIRAFTPWPGAHTFRNEEGKRRLVKIWEAIPVEGEAAPGDVMRASSDGFVVGCGRGVLEIRVLQREGGRRLSARDFLMGTSISAGERLG